LNRVASDFSGVSFIFTTLTNYWYACIIAIFRIQRLIQASFEKSELRHANLYSPAASSTFFYFISSRHIPILSFFSQHGSHMAGTPMGTRTCLPNKNTMPQKKRHLRFVILFLRILAWAFDFLRK
jgi:hypothetical protein